MDARDVLIVSAVRTPFGKFGGALRDTPGLELAAHVLREVLTRVGLDAAEVDEVYLGTCVPAETGTVAPVVARQALLSAGYPESTVSMTVDRACCSSLSAVQLGYRAIRLGEADVVVAAGSENLSRVPYTVPQLRWGSRMGHVEASDPLLGLAYPGQNPVSVDAGEVGLEHGFDRDALDRWALSSQQRYSEALAQGKFADEIVPLTLQTRKGPVTFDRDEFPKPDTTLESLSRLPTVYGSPTVTAGNAPGLDAGAAAVLLMSREKAEKLGLSAIARVAAVASVATAPRQLASVPAPAIRRALAQAGIELADLDLIEINEAFAAMPLVTSAVLADGDAELARALQEKTNVNGGAVAIGHPVGASGARILLTLAYELRRRGAQWGAAGICGGLGQGDAAIVTRA